MGGGLFSHQVHSGCPLPFSGTLLFPLIVHSSRTPLRHASPATLSPRSRAHTISLLSIPPTCPLISFLPPCLGPALSLPVRVPTWASSWAPSLGEGGHQQRGQFWDSGFVCRSDLDLSPAPRKVHVLRRDIRRCTHPHNPPHPPTSVTWESEATCTSPFPCGQTPAQSGISGL